MPRAPRRNYPTKSRADWSEKCMTCQGRLVRKSILNYVSCEECEERGGEHL